MLCLHQLMIQKTSHTLQEEEKMDADKELSYQVSMAGTTTKVKLTKAE